MNFSAFHNLDIDGHKDIDFVDIRVETDAPLYVDPERIALSAHPLADIASHAIEDFFETLCYAARTNDMALQRDLVSFGREPNETHLGLSRFHSHGNGSSPEILLPIVREMIDLGLFQEGLVTQLSDLHLWTPHFGGDRLSDLVTNIIRGYLYQYTSDQYAFWGLDASFSQNQIINTWSAEKHQWESLNIPMFMTGGYPTLLVPKAFVGFKMLSTPGELLQKYALKYRQKEHLDARSPMCHYRRNRIGEETLVAPTKKELRDKEIKGHSEKAYLLELGHRYPTMVNELHTDNRLTSRHFPLIVSDHELDSLLYGINDWAV